MSEQTADPTAKAETRRRRQKLQSVWNQMKQRCRNPNDPHYPRYGARGIQVLWPSFAEFVDWSEANGYQPGLSIDRIDNDGNYEPGNCRWTDSITQMRNRSDNRMFSAFGETKCIADWVDDPRCVVNYTTLVQRVAKSDWPTEEMLTTPPLKNQMQRIGRGHVDVCPAGHDLTQTRVWNKRGDYVCRTCRNDKARARYHERKAACAP
jgi:hypothetical protein